MEVLAAGELFTEALQRAQRIDWKQADRNLREGSQIALMREFLRRAALWAQALGRVTEWPFLSVPDEIASRSTEIKSLLDALPQERIGEITASLPYYPKRIVSSYAKWNVIRGLEPAQSFLLPDPYEPLLLAFQRGGIFRIENRMFQFNLARFPLGSVSSLVTQPPFTELDEQSLAGWDEKWRREMEEINSPTSPPLAGEQSPV